MTVTSKKKSNQQKVEESSISRGAINYHCDYCSVDIEDHRIRCSECEEFDLCVHCFTHGEETGNHKKTHGYSIIKKHTFPIFEKEWGADEELLLLEALEMYGVGSWADCSEYIGSKTKEDCEAHYLRVYMNTKFCPLPDTSKNFDPDLDTTINRKYHKTPAPKNKVWASQPSNHDVQGYMPGRLEFETEFDNEGENAIKDLSFHEDDCAEEIEFKLALLDAYNNKLNKREYRKRFLTERGLTDYKKNQTIEKKRTREEKQIYNGLKVFARLQTTDDHIELFDGFLKEEELKIQIAKLQDYRRLGIETFSDAEMYETLREQRESSSRPTLPREKVQLPAERPSFVSTALKMAEPEELSEPAPPLPVVEKRRQIGRKAIQPLDISQAEGIELLLPEESQLASALRLLPKTYLMIKETLIRECAIRGSLRRRQARELIKIDVNKTARVYDLLALMGWVRAYPA